MLHDNNDLNNNTVNKITKKISNKDNFIPLNLLINVIKEYDLKKMVEVMLDKVDVQLLTN